MCSWCALGDDCYLFFVGKGVLCCRRLASCTYSRRCNGVAFNTENTLFRLPINRQSCGVTTEIRFYTKWSSSRQQLCMLRQMLEISRYGALTLSFRVFSLIVWTTSERKTPAFETFRDETLAMYSKNNIIVALLCSRSESSLFPLNRLLLIDRMSLWFDRHLSKTTNTSCRRESRTMTIPMEKRRPFRRRLWY